MITIILKTHVADRLYNLFNVSQSEAFLNFYGHFNEHIIYKISGLNYYIS